MSDWWTKHFAAPSRTFRLVSLASVSDAFYCSLRLLVERKPALTTQCLAVLMAVIVAVWYTIRMRRADRSVALSILNVGN